MNSSVRALSRGLDLLESGSIRIYVYCREIVIELEYPVDPDYERELISLGWKESDDYTNYAWSLRIP